MAYDASTMTVEVDREGDVGQEPTGSAAPASPPTGGQIWPRGNDTDS